MGVLLVASGALMYAASWQRWAGACAWGDVDGTLCTLRQDHLYDFVAPSAPWEPVGDAAQLAGWSLLALTVAFALLPVALTGRRPPVISATAVLGARHWRWESWGQPPSAPGSPAVSSTRSPTDLAVYVWVFAPPALLVRFAIAARGWPLAAAVSLILATPLVAAFSYAIGPYDARPWWEAISGLLTATAGLCLLVAAAVPCAGHGLSPLIGLLEPDAARADG